MKKPRPTAVDAALAQLAEVRKLVAVAKTDYPKLIREIAALPTADDAECTAEVIAQLKRKKELQAQADALRPALEDGPTLIKTALLNLRRANGVDTISFVTPEIGALVTERLGQGYSLTEVSLMIGCSTSTVANIKSGRYRYSDRPEASRVGSRGHRRPI